MNIMRVIFLSMGAITVSVSLLAQQTSVLPQPRADQLPPPGSGSPKLSQTVPRPEGLMPKVPAGFTVSVYAELQAPRMMTYAPNGDLFVSSPAGNNITVFRDANSDGVFEARTVFAQGAARGRGGFGGGALGGAPGGRAAAPGGARGAAPPQAAPAAPGGARGAAPPQAAPAAPAGAAPAGARPGGAAQPAGGPAPGPGRGAGGGNPGGRRGGGPSILGAAAPACTPPPAFVQGGAGTLQAPFGMAFHDGYLYVANTGSLIRYKYANGDVQAQGEPEKLLDLPVGGHSTRNIIFNRAGTKLYIAVGSASNNDAGEDCRRAAILEFNPDGTGYRVFASGIRNPVGLALQPGTDIIWTAMNERDNLGDELVPDYATSVKDGGFYGWPYAYMGRNPDPRFVGAFPDLVGRAIVPDVLLPAHSAALGMAFYTATQFPARYRNGGFVALHGSWNRSVAAGYEVVFFPMSNGTPGPIEDFMTGLLASDGTHDTPIQKWGQPVGVTVARDGALLVSDDTGNRIWKISAGAR